MNPAREATQRRSGLRATLLLGAAGIALFIVVAIAVLWAMGDPKDHLPASGGPAAATAAPGTPAASAPATPILPVTVAPSATPATPPGATPLPEDMDPAWREVPVIFQNRDVFGPVGLYVFAGLRNAEDAMQPCYASGQHGGAEAADGSASPAVLMLYLVSRPGAIDVVDVRLDDAGTTDPDVVECCRAVLRGYEFKTPNAQPGRRYRLKYPLS